jgi:hypothetical protein
MKYFPLTAAAFLVALIAVLPPLATAAMIDYSVEPPQAMAPMELIVFEADEVTNLGPGYWSTDSAFVAVGASDHDLVFIPDWVVNEVRTVIQELQGIGELAKAADWLYWDDRVTFKHVGAHVPEVPIPAAVWLFASALLGLIAVSRRST